MGLYVNHLDTVSLNGERSLYIYLLDYGWSDSFWRDLFQKHFMTMANRASETGAVVVASPNGVHFANEVLSWHRVGHLDASRVLPGILLTKTHPNLFHEDSNDDTLAAPGFDDLLVVPLAPFCTTEAEFISSVERIFSDLKNGFQLANFSIAKHSIPLTSDGALGRRIVNAVELKPGMFGMSVNLKSLLGLQS